MTAISTTGSVSSLGIGSGLDVTSIISGLMKVEQAPLTDLQTKATAIQSTISAFGTVTSTMSTFRDAAAALALPSTWNATVGTSADSTSVGVTTASGAAAGNYAVNVTQLAASQSTVSGTFSASSALVGAGTLHFDVGSWSTGNAAFTAKSGSTGVDVTVDATDTLDTLASKINAANAGVTASVVNDNTGSRLVFSSQSTGVANGFRVTATDSDGGNTDASGLSALAYDPAGGTSTTTQTQGAADASATINGLTVTSSSNTLTGVVNGLTLNLNKVTTSGAVQVSVAQDSAGVTKSVQSFIDSYNALSSLLSTDLAYDSATKVAGPLQADSTAVSLQRQLRSIIGSASGASSTFSTLSQVGIEVQTDGTLKLNSTTFNAALANPTELKKAFTNVDSATTGNNGFANQLRTFSDSVLGGTGLLTSRVAGLNKSLTSNQTDQNNLSDRLAATQARLQAQYTALDTKMAGISTLSTYITQQIANWNKSTG